MSFAYPAGLPHPLREGYGFRPENNILRTPMQSGRARQRVTFTSVPDYASWTFHMRTQGEAQLFTSWRKLVGASWFTIEFTSPEGLLEQEARFMESPTGPYRSGVSFWTFEANVEVRDRFTLGPEWAEVMPDAVLDSGILDFIPNREWPLYSQGAGAEVFDLAINFDWPEV